MTSLHLDATTTELLITGAVEIDDVPPGFDWVARLINKAQEPATAEELSARVATVTTFAATVRSRPVVRAKAKRTFAFPKFPAKVLALAAPVVLVGGSVATATDSLPPSAQAAVSRALSSLGISVPKPQSDSHVAGLPPSSTGSTAAVGMGSVAGPRSQATVGLCREWKAGALNYNRTAYRNLAAAAGGVEHLPAYCAGAPVSFAPDGATGHAGKLPSTTGGTKTAAHAARSKPEAIVIRRSGAVAGGRAAASTAARATTTWRHGREAPGTSRHSGGSSGGHRISAGLLVPQRTRPSTKAGQWEPPASKSSTQRKSGATSPVWASPVSSSILAGRGPSQHNGQAGRPPRPRGCTDSARPGHAIRAHHCHPVTPTASKNNATSTGSGRHGARPPRRVPSVGSKPRSVKHGNGM